VLWRAKDGNLSCCAWLLLLLVIPMIIVADERCTGYSQPSHPERPERISATLLRLRSQNELPLQWAMPEAVEDAVLLRAHTPEHLARLSDERDFDVDTPYFP